MGEKKKKEAAMKTVNKVLIVGACVLFVVLMIISGMGSGWLTMFSVIKPGDTVVIDYTLYDAAGNPVITSEQTTYNQAVTQGRDIFATKQLTIISNQTMEKRIYAVQGYASTGSNIQQLAIFSPEYNAISSGIIGMKINEQKRIPISSDVSMTHELSVEQLALSKLNLTDISVGDIFFMGVSDYSEENTNSTTPNTYLRVGEVSAKYTDGVVVDLSYPKADVRVVSINKR